MRLRSASRAENRDFQLYLEVKARFETIYAAKTVIDTEQPLGELRAAGAGGAAGVELTLSIRSRGVDPYRLPCLYSQLAAVLSALILSIRKFVRASVAIQSVTCPQLVLVATTYDKQTFCSVFVLICSLVAASGSDRRTRRTRGYSPSVLAQIHDSAIVVDTHADTPQRFLDEGFDIGSTDPKDIGHISLDKARRGNLGAEFFSIWVEPETNQGHFARHTFDLIDSVYEQAARHPDRMMMAFLASPTSSARTESTNSPH